VDRPKSSLSHHFRVLRESGVVATTRQGVSLMNTLRRDDLDDRFPHLLDAILDGLARSSTRKKKPASSKTA
jgi:DNA-binding transcriptional ArsR family regulator